MTEIDSIIKANEKLTIKTTNSISKEDSPDVIVYWTFIIEVNKSDVINVTDVGMNTIMREKK